MQRWMQDQYNRLTWERCNFMGQSLAQETSVIDKEDSEIYWEQGWKVVFSLCKLNNVVLIAHVYRVECQF